MSTIHLFRLLELQIIRKDGPGRVPFNNGCHPHSFIYGMSKIGKIGKKI